MTFRDYLVEKNIPFKEHGENIWVEDSHLIPYMNEVLIQFPDLTFDIEIDDFEDPDYLEDWDDIDVNLDELEDKDWKKYWEDPQDEEEFF